MSEPPDAALGRSVVVATRGQLPALLAAIEFDGIARRLVFCSPELSAEHIRHVLAVAEADLLVVDDDGPSRGPLSGGRIVKAGDGIAAAGRHRGNPVETEWVLLTPGTTGMPKLVAYSLDTLTATMHERSVPGSAAPGPVWGTFYDIRRYGGLQVALRALLCGGSLVLSDAGETVCDFLSRAGRCGVTHMTGTPTHWRRVLMSEHAGLLAPDYVCMSGEIADQAILDQLRDTYPWARVVHAFASTEVGVAFEVADGRAGFPAALVGQAGAAVEMRIEGGTLRIRSARTARAYFGPHVAPLAGDDGFVDTGDVVERRGDRYYFAGRLGGIIDVGGAKVFAEKVEAAINRHPDVLASLVTGRHSPITGGVVTAEIAACEDAQLDRLGSEILMLCRAALDPHEVPAAIRLVPDLDVCVSGKLARSRE